MKLLSTSLALYLGLTFFSSANAGYTITDLGVNSFANAINNHGQVVGRASNGRAFLYSNGTMKDLGTLQGSFGWSNAKGINNLGQIVGESTYSSATNSYRAFLYSNGSMTDLGTMGGEHSSASSINDRGQIVGLTVLRSTTSMNKWGEWESEQWSFLYENGSMSNTPTYMGYADYANSINNNGEIVGTQQIKGVHAIEQGWSYSNGVRTPLWGLDNGSYASDVNDSGQIVGYFEFVQDSWGTAALFSNGTITNLGTLGGGASSFASAINNLGQIVGYSRLPFQGPTHAFLYSDGSMLDLNNLIDPNSGWTLTEAKDINDLGQIVGWGEINGQTHGYLLTPTIVPIPGAVWLLGSGLLGIIGLGRRKRLT